MRIVSYNVNGIRSAMSKGLVEWLANDICDVLCLQEIKAHKENVDYTRFEALGFETYWFPATKKGYSGTAIFTKISPDRVFYGNGHPQSDAEGRWMGIDIGKLTIICAYFPSGTSGEERQQYKYQWLDECYQCIQDLIAEGRDVILCGDYNICHKEIDIHDPKGNKNSSGFLPEERAWMDKYFALPMIDTFRYKNPDPHQYSWWSYRANARANNKGWRIDYISCTPNLKDQLQEVAIWPDVKHSDHCPVFASFNL